MYSPDTGGNAQASTCSSVVLPAPDGPITANCSPSATCKSRAWRADTAPARAAGCRAATCFSCSFKRAAPVPSEQARAARRRFDALVVVGPGRHEAGGSLQVEDILAFGVASAERQQC